MKKLATLLLLTSVVCACAPAPPEREALISEVQRPVVQSVEVIWRSKERIIQAALEGGEVSEEGYMEACEFFERLTGIPIRGKGTFVGWLPNEHTAEDLQAVRAWYSVNRDRLYIDEETQSVEVRPAIQ